MDFGLSGAPLNPALRYADPIQQACDSFGFSPQLAYALALNETIGGELVGLWPSAAQCLSADGGHGLFQLTSSFPLDWDDPFSNAKYAVRFFMISALDFWTTRHDYRDFWGKSVEPLHGTDLVRAIAASFNAGIGGALRGHMHGDVDLYTTDKYARRALVHYQMLVAHMPVTP